MAKLADLTSGNYLKSADIKGREVPVTLSHITAEKMPDLDGKVGATKHIAYFAGKDKGIVLNKTNLGILQEMGLEDTDAIPPNFNLILFVMQVPFQGQMVDGLRMRAANGMSVTTAPPVAPPVDESDIPF